MTTGSLALGTGTSRAPRFGGHEISVSFEGIRAVDGVSVEVLRGEVLGLIGPNGAGKTTLVNAITGFVPLTAGRLMLGEDDVTGLRPHQLARRGVARTFQSVRLFTRLTVAENVEVAAVSAGANRRDARRRALAALDALGIRRHARSLASSLPYGEERRLALARAVVGDPSFLLLDEPAAGLDEDESDDLARIIRELRDMIGCGVLLIEHDMRVIMGLCDRIQVVDYGKTIDVGTPHQIRSSDRVIAAYLGTEPEKVGPR